MTHLLVLALFRDVSSAAAAARDLHALGVKREDLSVVARDHSVESAIATQIDGSPGSEIEDSLTASHLGELGGYILAAIAIGLPGTGAVVAAGPLAAGLGELAGHVAGGLKATLMKTGLADAEADRWRAQIESGRAILLGVHVRSTNGDQVESALSRYGIGQVAHTQWED